MNQIFSLIKPRLLSMRNRGVSKSKGLFLLLFMVIGITFWFGIFGVSYKALVYFHQIEGMGNVLALKLLSMVLVTFFSLLIFSSILATLFKLFLSRDLQLVFSLPVPGQRIFFARWIESTFDSSWMFIVYTIPVLIAYGVIYKAGFLYYSNMIFVLICLCLFSSALSALLILPVVMILPASRLRNIFVFMGLFLFIILYIVFRLIRPERLVDPETFASVMIYLQTLQTPSSPFLPSTWAFDSLKAALDYDISNTLFNTSICFSGTVFFILITIWIAELIYYKGYSKTQSAMQPFFEKKRQLLDSFLFFLPGHIRALIVKEIKVFFRDQTQWSQIFLIASLIFIYVYNFSVLPLGKSPIKTIYLQNFYSFLNMTLASFVLIAVSARFAFPSISLEGPAFWIIRSSPIKIGTFLRIKYVFYLIPLLLLAEILIISTNILLQVTPLMMWISIITILLITPGIVSISIGFGAAYPDFTSENPAQSITSFGGLMFMILSAVYIGVVILLEAGPVYTLIMTHVHSKSLSVTQLSWIICSFSFAFMLSIFAIVWPMSFGIKKLDLKV